LYRFASGAVSGTGLTAEELVDPEIAKGASRRVRTPKTS